MVAACLRGSVGRTLLQERVQPVRVSGSSQRGSSPLGKSLWENPEWRKAVSACLCGVWGWAWGLGRTLLGETGKTSALSLGGDPFGEPEISGGLSAKGWNLRPPPPNSTKSDGLPLEGVRGGPRWGPRLHV